MIMNNRYNQTEILEALNRLTESNKTDIDSDLLKEAEDRVWLSISKFVFSKQLVTPMPNNTQSTPSSQLSFNWKQWWQNKHRLVFIFLGSFTILIIVAIFSYNIAFKLIKPQTQLNSTDELISLEELRTKAEAKFIKLSNGISFQEMQQLTNTPSNNPRYISDQPGQPIIDEKLKQEIQNREDPNNLTVFFSELEEKYFLPQNLPFADFDISKNLTIKIWISGSFAKAIYYYDGKIINLSVNTPEYQISYLGGKYAIKGVYTEPYYLSGITTSFPKEVEIELLKSLLNPIDPNRVIDYGLQTINNKKLRVIEVKYDDLPSLNNEYNISPNEKISTTSNQKQATQTVTDYIFTTSTKYYFDQNDLTLYLTEDYTNNQLLKQTKITKNQVLEKQQADKVFHYQELGNLPIKQYKIYSHNPDDYLVANFVQKYDLFFIPELGIENIGYTSFSNHDHENDEDYEDYYFDPDFNPNLKQEDLVRKNMFIPPKNLLGSYGQNPVNFDIYEQNKPTYEEVFYGYYIHNTSFKIKQERDIQILLDNKFIIKGKYTELTRYYNNLSNDKNSDIEDYLIIEFKVGNYFYILSYILTYNSENSTTSSSTNDFDLKKYLSQDQIRLSKLTLEQAKEIDEKNQQKYLQNDTTTPPQSTTNLD